MAVVSVETLEELKQEVDVNLGICVLNLLPNVKTMASLVVLRKWR